MSEPDRFTSRIQVLIIFGAIVFAIFTLRLLDVQIFRAHGYAARASRELLNTSVLLAPRGTITDINGVVLARSVVADNIVVDQTLIVDPVKAASIAAPILNQDPVLLTQELTGKKRYQIIAKKVTPATWNQLQQAFLDYNQSLLKVAGGKILAHSKSIYGFFAERSYVRDYPTGALASSLVGITNDAGVGAAGLEASLDSKLQGSDGKYEYLNGAGAIIPGSQQIITEAKPGTNIRLTIDRDIQWVAQDAISAAVKSAKAKSGTVIVMDPHTGAILAQASAPNFDPNDRKTITLASLRNPAVQDVYDPGSTGKVITVSAAMEEGKLTPTTIWTIPYRLVAGGSPFTDHEHHPTERLTTTGLLAQSSNTGAIQIGQKLGGETLDKYLKAFGIGASTGSQLPGESVGILPPIANWSATSLPTFSFGQGYSVTAMQATDVFATIANNGVLVHPHVVAGYTDATGSYHSAPIDAGTRVVSSATASAVRMMLESVVSDQGTAPEAAIPGYRVAGKTGTAMLAGKNCRCYDGYTASFIGFAPADAPAYVVSVKISQPQGAHFGGQLGGPVFKKVMSFVLQQRQIAPTAPATYHYPLTESELAGALPTKSAVTAKSRLKAVLNGQRGGKH